MRQATQAEYQSAVEREAERYAGAHGHNYEAAAVYVEGRAWWGEDGWGPRADFLQDVAALLRARAATGQPA